MLNTRKILNVLALLAGMQLLTGCDALLAKFIADQIGGDGTTTAHVDGEPSPFSQTIYDEKDLSDLCDDNACDPGYDNLPDDFVQNYSTDDADTCGFDYNPNDTSQFVLRRNSSAVNGLDLLFSKEDLFFLAWASMRSKINPHFLMAVLAQESYGNCAAVSSADAEGCFQITNYYGRLQLEQSYPDRVSSWYWANPDSYYPDSIFIDQLTWFGETPATDQFRMTLDPTAAYVLSISVSSVVNFNFGVIASGLYYNWQQYFLYYNYSSLNDTVKDILDTPGEKASVMAGAYNGGISRMSDSIDVYGIEYAAGLRSETLGYIENVQDYCTQFQNGHLTYDDTYNADEVDYLIDLLALTYPDTGIDWDTLKTDVRSNFFAEVDELSFTDDIKALIYYISTYDPALAPEMPEDIDS